MSNHDHYFFDIPPGVTRVDIYRLIEIIGITCPVAQHVFKKAAAAGRRGHKDLRLDWEDILDSAKRKLVMLDEDDHTSDLVVQAANKIFGTPEPPAKHQQAILDGHEVDTDFDTEKTRMPQVGTNGNEGEHYAEVGYGWVANTGEVPKLPGDTKVQAIRRDGAHIASRIHRLSWARGGLPTDIMLYRIIEVR